MTILSFIIVLGILVFVHELGHFIFAKLVGVRVLKFSLGFGPKLIGRKFGDTEYLISAVPLGGYVKPLGEEPGEEISEADKPFSYNYQTVWKKFLIVFAGPLFNFALTYIIFLSFLSYGFPVGVPKTDNITAHVDEILKDSPAEKAGLKVGDKIIFIGNKEILAWDEMTEIVSKSPEKELNVTVERGEQRLNVKIAPRAEKIKNIRGEEVTVGRMGIAKKKLPVEYVTADNLFEAPLKAFEATYKTGFEIFRVVIKLVTGSLSVKTLGGPIAIASESGKAAALGILSYIMFLAFISVNLAVLNLLPIPVLDGGHILFLIIEGIRRKPLSERVMMVTQRIGIALLLTLMVFVIYNDSVKIIIPWIQKILMQ